MQWNPFFVCPPGIRIDRRSLELPKPAAKHRRTDGALAIVMIENIARICIIAMGFRWDINLSEGLPHSVLGLVMFLLSMLLVCSLDQLQNSFQLRKTEFKSQKLRTEFRSFKNPVTWLSRFLQQSFAALLL